ncbi:MAG: hypothetical protein AAFU77_01835 [Myxococcota bacterium]
MSLDNGWVFNVDFTGAWASSPADPVIFVVSTSELSVETRDAIAKRFRDAYSDNFHNRYHMFNISAGYAW